MKALARRSDLRAAGVAALLALSTACSGGHGTSDGAAPTDGSVSGDASQSNQDLSPAPPDLTADLASDMKPAPPSDLSTGAASLVTFSYTPGWDGVTEVTVVGGFHQADDWKTPLLTLTKGANGTFSGSMMLPAAQYLYVFHVTGDSDAAPTTIARYALDPDASTIAACPTASPTYDAAAVNPCSQLTVPQAAAAPMYHVTGTVQYDATPVTGYLAIIERLETGYHHFFVNRSTVGATGAYDLSAAAGTYRMQVWYPNLERLSDAKRNPLTYNALRRAISEGFPVAANHAVGSVEMAYAAYAKLAPTGATPAQKLPTTFTWSTLANAAGSAMAVYAVGAAGNIGDPWFTSMAGTTASFDGTFNTAQATVKMAVAGTTYYWGTNQAIKAVAGGPTWAGESMVFPIAFQ